MAIFRNNLNPCAPGAISASPVMTTARNRTIVTASEPSSRRNGVERKSRLRGRQRLSRWRSPAFRPFAGLAAGADSALAGGIAGHPLLATVGPRGHAGRRARLHVFGRLHVLGRAGLGRAGTDVALTRSAGCRLGLRERTTDRQCENAGGCQEDFLHGSNSLD